LLAPTWYSIFTTAAGVNSRIEVEVTILINEAGILVFYFKLSNQCYNY